jgi:hypothetical protein
MAGKRFGIGSAALALAVLALTGGCDRWWQTPPTSKAPIAFPTGDFAIATSFESGEGAASSRTYDLSDLLAKSDDARSEPTAPQILATIRGCLPPNRTIELEGDRLTAELTEREHSDLARMLEDWRRGGVTQIVVESRFITPDLSAVTPIAWNQIVMQGSGTGGLPVFGARITETQLVQLLRDVQGETRSGVRQAPKVTLFNGQSLTFADVVARPFVTDVKLVKNGAFQPVVETVEEGVKIAVRPSTNGDGQIELAVELSATEIGEVSEVELPFRHPSSPRSSITVQAPSVTATSTTAVVRLTKDESFLICVPGARDPKNPKTPTLANFFVFTPYLLEAEEASAAAGVSAAVRR